MTPGGRGRDRGTTVIVGGTRGLGRHLAERLTSEDLHVVITGRKLEHAQAVAGEIGGGTSALALDLTVPDAISEALQSVATVDHVVLAAIERDSNSIREYDIERAVELATMKLVGYTEVLHTLASRLHDLTSVLLFGGVAKDRPYPGSTTVSERQRRGDDDGPDVRHRTRADPRQRGASGRRR